MSYIARRMLALVLCLVASDADAQLIFRNGFENPTLVINEIVNDGGDAVEFFNASAEVFDLSGWYFTDDDPTHVYTFPPGATVAGGGYLVVDDELTFALGAIDTVSLYTPDSELFSEYRWPQSATAPGSHSRCPNGLGPFTIVALASLGTTNGCPVVRGR